MTPAAPKPRLRVALQGFSDFERSALASYFRLAGDRFPAYEETERLADASFVVADADEPVSVQEVVDAGRAGDTIFIGAQPPEGALAWMMRPIDPLHVLRELDLAALSREPAPEVAPDAPARRSSDTPAPDRTIAPDVLLVDSDDTTGRALERELQALGQTVARAAGSGKALELLARLACRFVFIDIDLGETSEMDGLNLCQHIKRQHRAEGTEAPTIVLLASRNDPVDRVRGTLAGCDAYLPKPPDEHTLRRVLSSHGAAITRPGPLRALPR